MAGVEMGSAKKRSRSPRRFKAGDRVPVANIPQGHSQRQIQQVPASITFAKPLDGGFYRYCYLTDNGREQQLKPGEWLDDKIVPGSVRHDHFEEVEVPIRSARRSPEVSLKTHGFALVKHAEACSRPDFRGQSEYKSWLHDAFFPHVAKAVRSTVEGAVGAGQVQAVHIFDSTLRTTDSSKIPAYADPKSVVAEAHTDFSAESGKKRLDAEEVLFKWPADSNKINGEDSAWIVNLWQPLVDTVLEKPLALCDLRSVKREDLIRKTMYFPKREGAVYNVKHNPEQLWWYAPLMRMDEAWVFVSWTPDGKSVPHQAVVDPAETPKSSPRHSMEVRCAVKFHSRIH